MEPANWHEFTVEDRRKERVDTVVSRYLSSISRSELHHRLKIIEINGKECKNSQKVNAGDRVRVCLVPAKGMQLIPIAVKWEVIFETDEVLVINKPPHIPMHPGAGIEVPTIAAGVLHYLKLTPEDFPGHSPRPGIVHRLDADTSGVMIIAKNTPSLRFLSAQFAARTVKKVYAAIVKGIPVPPEGSVNLPLARHPVSRMKYHCPRWGGKPAYTHYALVVATEHYGLLRCEPLTGRTHQIRVHMQHRGHPILGDPLYARKDPRHPEASLMLHACALQIRLPGEEKSRCFSSSLPPRFAFPLSCEKEELCQKDPLFFLTPV